MDFEQDKELQQKVATYKPSEHMLTTVREVPILLAVGISGAGKDTMLQRLLATYPNDYRQLVTTTTRPPRVNDGIPERDGVDYYFITKETANHMLDDGAYIEANYYASNVYGASIDEVAKAGQDGKILVTDLDVNGVGNFMRLGMNAKPIFVLPPNYQVWRERVQRRYHGVTVDPADLQKRLQTALAELENALANEYFYLLVNDNLEHAVKIANDIVRGKDVDPRHPKAVEVTKQLAADIGRELAKNA
jgi:guanylate kinase